MSRGELARVAGATPRGVETALAELGASYEGTGLRLQNAGDEWQIVTAPDHARRGAELARADGASERVVRLIARHHERPETDDERLLARADREALP